MSDPEHAATSDLDRLIFLSDGVFAIAMTLLVVQFTLPLVTPNGSASLAARLLSLGPMYLSYTLSFLVIANYWTAHQRLFRHVARVDTALVWLNLLLLLCIAFQPFPTSVLGNYAGDPAAVTLYAATLTVTGVLLFAMWLYALRRRLVTRDFNAHAARPDLLLTASVPVVFAISIAIAQVNTSAAEYSWIAIGIVRAVVRRGNPMPRLPWRWRRPSRSGCDTGSG